MQEIFLDLFIEFIHSYHSSEASLRDLKDHINEFNIIE